MSETNQISGVDTLGYEWHAACGDTLEPEARADGSVAMLNFQDDGGHFSEKEAARLATFLLAASGPDVARETLAKLAPEIFRDMVRDTIAATQSDVLGAVARAELAEKRLAAVLALTATEVTSVYVGRAGEDLGLNPCAQRVVDLIRSRATEGVEAPTGATT